MNKKTLRIIGIVIGVVIVGVVALMLIPRSTILLSVAPDEFTISIDGKKGELKKTGDSLSLSPGTHSVSISRDEFKTYETSITVKNKENFEVLIALEPLTDAARELLNSEKSQAIIQRITGKRMTSDIEKVRTDYPIISKLPIEDKYFTISSCPSVKYPNDATKVAICVYLFDPEAKESADDELQSLGFNLDDYEILYVDSVPDPEADQQLE